MENADILMMLCSFVSFMLGYWLSQDNPLGFDEDEAHLLLSLIVAVACAAMTITLYTISL